MVISDLLAPRIITLITILATLIILIIILSIIQNRLQKKASFQAVKVERNESLKEKIESLRLSTESSQKKLQKINEFSKKLLTDHFQLPNNLDHSEMAKRFSKMHKLHLELFCKQMIQILYSGEPATDEQLSIILRNFEKIVEEENIHLLTSETGSHSVLKIKSKSIPIISKKTQVITKPIEMPGPKPSININRELIKIQPKTSAPQIKAFKKLPNETVEIYTVKNEVLQSSKSSPKSTIELPSLKKPSILLGKAETLQHKKIESIDDLERIKSKIDLRKKLRNEAQIN